MKTKALTNHYTRRLLARAMLLCIASLLLSVESPIRAADADDADKQLCIRQLEHVFQAVQAYRRNHKDLPEWLTDLVPQYIADTNLLICPITRRTGQTHTFEHLKDPKLPTAYLFEFSPLPMGRVFNGGQVRMRDFKRRQMGLVGGEVPIVRCHLHQPVLNLGFNGHIYASLDSWEADFTDVVDYSAWSVDKHFPESPQTTDSALQPAPGNVPSKAPPGGVAARTAAATAGLPPLRIPPREAQTPPNLIDLSAFYNAGFKGNWVDNVADNDLSELPVGIQELAGTRFDVRGLIQLHGNKADPGRFPDRVTGLHASGKCSRVHFLHGTMWTSGATNVIAKYIFHYADGTTLERPMVVRKDVMDWWAKPPKSAYDNGIVVAWSGQNRMTRGVGGGQTIQIYKTTWENPKPDVEITHIDFVSTKKAADPFLIAITVE